MSLRFRNAVKESHVQNFCAICFVLVATFTVAGKDVPTKIINWPQAGSPVVRVTLGKFKEISSAAGQHNYLMSTLSR
jgi:hypothetical protein